MTRSTPSLRSAMLGGFAVATVALFSTATYVTLRARGRPSPSAPNGLPRRVTHLRDLDPLQNDPDLADRIRSEAFRGLDLPHGRINVSAENGVIVLIGELDRPDEIAM